MCTAAVAAQIRGFEEQLRQEDDRFIEKEQAFIQRNKEERDLISRRAEVLTTPTYTAPCYDSFLIHRVH